MPELYIITGSNGAGKSSVGRDYLPLHLQQKNILVDTSEAEHKVLAVIKRGMIKTSVLSDQLPGWFLHYLPQISQLVEGHDYPKT
jgi:hypothetical protein